MSHNILYTDFADLYDRIAGKTNEQIERDVETILHLIDQYSKTDPQWIVDIGCGSGSHINVLQSQFCCLGLDLHKEMLSVCQNKASVRPSLVQGDMRSLPVEDVGVIISLFATIIAFESENQIQKVFAEIHEALADGGIFISEITTVPDRTEKDTKRLASQDIVHSEYEVTTVSTDGRDIVVIQISQFAVSTQYVEYHYTIVPENAPPQRATDEFKFLLLEKDNVKRMLEDAGFTNVEHHPDAFRNGGFTAMK